MGATSHSLLAVLTRPQGRSHALSEALVRKGWEVLDCPALEITPMPLADREALPLPESYDLVIFVSVPAIEAYQQHLLQYGVKTGWPVKTKIGCVGQGSALAIRQNFGDQVQLMQPDTNGPQDSEGLWSVLNRQAGLLKRVLIVRGQDGRDWLASQLREKGAFVDFHVAYCRKSATWSGENLKTFKQLSLAGKHPVWLLTSLHGIQSVLAQFEAQSLLEWAAECRFILTHPRQAEALRAGLNQKLGALTGGQVLGKLSFLVSEPDQASILSNFEYFRDNESLA